MKIKRLKIQGFRSVADLDIELPQVCALIGPNNSGKSNILEAINRVLGKNWLNRNAFDEDDVTWRNPEGDIEICVELDQPLHYQPFKQSDPVDVFSLEFLWTRYKRGEQKGERRIQQTPKGRNGGGVVVPTHAPRKGVQTKYQPLTSVPQSLREQIPVIHIGIDRNLERQLPGSRYSLLGQLFEDIVQDFEDPNNSVEVVESNGAVRQVQRSKRFSEVLDHAMSLLRTGEFQAIEAEIKANALRQLGLDDQSDSFDFSFGPLGAEDFYRALDLVVREHGFSTSATNLGHGFQNALVLAILQVFEKRRRQGAVLLIEEPEMYLHPQLQRALYRTLRSIGETNQVIYVTHSPHFVSIPEFDEVLRVTKDSDGTKVRRSSLSRTPELEEKTRKELDPERNELFFARKVLLVEGDTEKLALPEYAQRLDISLDLAGVSIVEVGGKRNLPAFLDIAESFEIPTGVTYDRDASDFENDDNETEFNAALDARERTDGSIRVWQFDRKYEDHLRSALGESEYQRQCQAHPQLSKAIRARLIAADSGTPIPSPIEDVIRWLADVPNDGG